MITRLATRFVPTVLCCVLVLVGVIIPTTHGHAFLSRPASRNAQSYYFDPNDIKEWTPTQVFGGGVAKEYAGGTLQWPKGLHGVCGDAHDAVRQRWTEPRSIAATYTPGQVVALEVTMGTNHMGRFSFAICPTTDVTEECFEAHPLARADPLHPGKRFWYLESEGVSDGVSHEVTSNGFLPPGGSNSYINNTAYRVFYKLPDNITTEHGVLRWYWTTGNSCTPPCVEEDPHYPNCQYKGMAYCGEPERRPEEYWNCADIAILPDSGASSPSRPPAASARPLSSQGPSPNPSPLAPQPLPSTPVMPATPPNVPLSGPCQTTVPVWGPCGGMSGAPAGVASRNGSWDQHCCAPSLTCTFVNQWYWQCQPPSTRPTTGTPSMTRSPNPAPPHPPAPLPAPSANPSPNTNPSCQATVALWGQCGGLPNAPAGVPGRDGMWLGSCCAGTSSCISENSYYWQCRPSTQQPTPSVLSSPTPTPSPRRSPRPSPRRSPRRSSRPPPSPTLTGGQRPSPTTSIPSPTPSASPPLAVPHPSPTRSPRPSPTPSPPPPIISNPTGGEACTTTVALWSQCGGTATVPSGLTGSNGTWAGHCCARGGSCTFINQWYWQCTQGSSSTPSPSPTPSPTGSPLPTPSPIPQGSYNYADVLALSFSFYEAQQTGVLPAWNRHNRATNAATGWRGDSYLEDGALIGKGLSGGWFDAGDHVKFGLPFGWTVAVLAWSMLENEQAYRSNGQWEVAKRNVGFAVDWMVKAHITASDSPGDNVYVCQVGDSDADHSNWCRPEDYRRPECSAVRTVSLCDRSSPGSNIVGNAAAAMAAFALVLKADDAASSQATDLLHRAGQLYAFGKAFPGGWRIQSGTNPYQSGPNRGEDEMLLAAAMLCKAQGAASSYCTTEVPATWSAASVHGDANAAGGDWDNAFNIAVQVLLATLPSSALRSAWVDRETANLNQWHVTTACPASDGQVCYSAKGLAHIQMWGTLRHTANAAAIKLAFAKYVGDDAQARMHRCWARRQMNMMLGDWGRSFVVGYGNNPPTHAHHRAASCPRDANQPCDWNSFNANDDNPGGPVGALVGGPNRADEYVDVRSDYVQNEVAIDYNAGFTAALAGLADLSARLAAGGSTWDAYCGGAPMPPSTAPSRTLKAASDPPEPPGTNNTSTAPVATTPALDVGLLAGLVVAATVALVAAGAATFFVFRARSRCIVPYPGSSDAEASSARLVQ